jgi:Na+-exporting ATPase
MVAKTAWIPSRGTYSVGNSSEPFNPTIGDLYHSPLPPREMERENGPRKDIPASVEKLLQDNRDLENYLNIASLANLANVHESPQGWHARGDPTEIALQVFVSRFNWNRSRWTTGDAPVWRQLAEFPFDSDVKRMSVIFEHIKSGEKHIFTKGAVERVIAACTEVRLNDGEGPVALTGEFHKHTLENMESMAACGLRVLALASRPFEGAVDGDYALDRAQIETGLTFRGLIGLYDPPRLESAASVSQCQTAGIAVHMVNISRSPL